MDEPTPSPLAPGRDRRLGEWRRCCARGASLADAGLVRPVGAAVQQTGAAGLPHATSVSAHGGPAAFGGVPMSTGALASSSSPSATRRFLMRTGLYQRRRRRSGVCCGPRPLPSPGRAAGHSERLQGRVKTHRVPFEADPRLRRRRYRTNETASLNAPHGTITHRARSPLGEPRGCQSYQ